jgi:cobalamin biosynthesis Mg chelatase CobN
VVAFTNLRTMVGTFLEAARTGVWHPDDDALVDWSAVQRIRARLNPGTSPPWTP